jgi:eukaryotic-like serine/threonine-protein kinase
MEFVEGETLRSILRQGRVLPVVAAAWLDQLLRGLEAAHRAGVVHRDLKPENIMIVQNGTPEHAVKILDFGIAKLSEGEEPAPDLTLTGMRVGTPFYMSPEQFDCGAIDGRSDLFSVAVIVLELLNGELPMTSFSVRDRFLAWLRGKEILPVSTENDLLLKSMLDTCLAEEPEARPGSAAELRTSLVPLVRNYRGAPDALA